MGGREDKEVAAGQVQKSKETRLLAAGRKAIQLDSRIAFSGRDRANRTEDVQPEKKILKPPRSQSIQQSQ